MIATLEDILEHGSHAWRELEVAGLVPEDLDGPWPPDVRPGYPPMARHLAAMLKQVKRLYDTIAPEGDPG